MKKKGKGQWYNRNDQIYSSVLFVPATKDSELAKRIKEAEAANRQGRKSRIKIVEKLDPQLKVECPRRLHGKSYGVSQRRVVFTV